MNISKSKEWQAIRVMFFDELMVLESKLDTKGKTHEQIGQEYVARQEAVKLIHKIIDKVEKNDDEVVQKKQSYV